MGTAFWRAGRDPFLYWLTPLAGEAKVWTAHQGLTNHLYAVASTFTGDKISSGQLTSATEEQEGSSVLVLRWAEQRVVIRQWEQKASSMLKMSLYFASAAWNVGMLSQDISTPRGSRWSFWLQGHHPLRICHKSAGCHLSDWGMVWGCML